jgi:hypothetical protein
VSEVCDAHPRRRGVTVSLSRAQVEQFCGDIAELFSIRPPRISHRRRVRCRWKAKTLHIGRKITRDELAHALAHYVQRELHWPHDPAAGAPAPGVPRRSGRIHGPRFNAWQRLIGNYIAQEFGEGEGVIL